MKEVKIFPEYSENAMKIYEKLYFDREPSNDNPNVFILKEDHPSQTHARIAKFIANTEEEYIEFLTMLNDKSFRGNTPTMLHAGVPANHPHHVNYAPVLSLD